MIGGLIVDKPSGLTSHDVVARVRRLLGGVKAGHAGTLDPFATGVLLVCLGRATRLAQYLVGLEKEYLATVRLGFATDTQDLTGKQITALCTSNEVAEEEIRRILNCFVGAQLQTPPMYSAKKVAGERLYRAAREGRVVERKALNVTIHSIDLLGSGRQVLARNPDGTLDLQIGVRCSSGTYIRTLAHDVGQKLGIGAHLAALRRTRVGRFSIEDAIALERLESTLSESTLERALIDPGDLIGHLPELRVGTEDAKRVSNGLDVRASPGFGGTVRLCDKEGKLIAVGEVDPSSGTIRPRVVLASA